MFSVSEKAVKKALVMSDYFSYTRPDGLLVIISKDDVWNYSVTLAVPAPVGHFCDSKTYWADLSKAIEHIQSYKEVYENYKKST